MHCLLFDNRVLHSLILCFEGKVDQVTTRDLAASLGEGWSVGQMKIVRSPVRPRGDPLLPMLRRGRQWKG